MKSKAGKEKWRAFMMEYEKKVDDYNFGTMLRNSPKVEYEEESTIFGMYSVTCGQRVLPLLDQVACG